MMKKRQGRTISILIFILVISFCLLLAYDNYLQKQLDLNNPNRISSYWNTSVYEFDPESILVSLDDDNAIDYIRIAEAPSGVDEMTELETTWTQKDFLNVANVLGELVWGENINSEKWSVYYIFFEGSCSNPYGLDFAKIVYFEEREDRYVTYLIEIDPHVGIIRLGDGETYPKPILRKWKSIDLFASKIYAEKALQLAGEDAKTHFQFQRQCGATISSPNNNDIENWHLKIFGAPDFISYTVNMKTGEYSFQNLDE